MLHRVKRTAVRLWKDEGGASLLEYSVLIGIILAVSIAAVIARLEPGYRRPMD